MSDKPETFLEWAARIGHYEVLKHYESYKRLLKEKENQKREQAK